MKNHSQQPAPRQHAPEDTPISLPLVLRVSLQSRPNPNFTVLDVADPSAPEVHAKLRLSESPSFTVRGVTLSGSLAYVAAGEGGLLILRYTGPIPPTR